MSAASRKRGHSANGSGRAKASKPQHNSKHSKASVNHHPQQQQSSRRSSAKLCQVEREQGLLQAIGRLLTIFIKGFAALVLFALIFNLFLVLLNKLVFKGKIGQYIPAKSWKDILGH